MKTKIRCARCRKLFDKYDGKLIVEKLTIGDEEIPWFYCNNCIQKTGGIDNLMVFNYKIVNPDKYECIDVKELKLISKENIK